MINSSSCKHNVIRNRGDRRKRRPLFYGLCRNRLRSERAERQFICRNSLRSLRVRRGNSFAEIVPGHCERRETIHLQKSSPVIASVAKQSIEKNSAGLLRLALQASRINGFDNRDG